MASSYLLTPLLLLFLHLEGVTCGDNSPPVLGHLLPLGSHTSPGEVEERFDIPSAKEFMERYVFPSKPVVFRGILKGAPMFEKWTDDYIAKTYPDLELRLEAKTEKEGYVPVGSVGLGRDRMKNFINTYHLTNKYVVSELPTPTWHEVLVPSFMTCGPVLKSFVEIDLWMSGGDTSSLLHKDAFNALNCLFNGTKEWKLFEYKYEKDLYKAYEAGNPLGGFSRINPEAVDMVKYPKVATVPWSMTTVKKGDCLFLPKSMYHQVKSYGAMNTAVALLFSRFDNVKKNKMDYTDCPSKFIPLQDIDVDLQYSGTGMMSMGYSELRIIRQQLIGLVGDSDRTTYHNILEATNLKDEHPLPHKERAQKILNILKIGNSGGKITKRSIKDLPRSRLREVGLLIEPFLPSNHYDFEYFQINPNEIAELLSILVKAGNGIIKRADFVKEYQDRLWGSEKFANNFFDDLAGPESTSIGKEEILKNFHIAAKKFDKTEGDAGEKEDTGDDEGPEETDAYIGRNIDLNSEKDQDTLKSLGSQIFDGSFTADSDKMDEAEDRDENDSIIPESGKHEDPISHDREENQPELKHSEKDEL